MIMISNFLYYEVKEVEWSTHAKGTISLNKPDKLPFVVVQWISSKFDLKNKRLKCKLIIQNFPKKSGLQLDVQIIWDGF